jgi:hypothetical protein
MSGKCLLVLLGLFLPVLAGGCVQRPRTRPDAGPDRTADLKPTRIDYVESDAFDVLLESALVNETPAVVIRTGHTRPDWGPRLNAWIASWNRGGPPPAGATYRMQAPLVPRLDGETIREFRGLVDDLMDRIEEKVREGSAWYGQERLRGRRVALLKPYNLRFHMNDEGFIEVIFFHGRYADRYPEFVESLAGPGADVRWRRGYTCSHCRLRDRPGDGEGDVSRGASES